MIYLNINYNFLMKNKIITTIELLKNLEGIEKVINDVKYCRIQVTTLVELCRVYDSIESKP